jgi:hypothetical protein
MAGLTSPEPGTTTDACSGNPTPAGDLAKNGERVSVTGTCSFTDDLVFDGSGNHHGRRIGKHFNLEFEDFFADNCGESILVKFELPTRRFLVLFSRFVTVV